MKMIQTNWLRSVVESFNWPLIIENMVDSINSSFWL